MSPCPTPIETIGIGFILLKFVLSVENPFRVKNKQLLSTIVSFYIIIIGGINHNEVYEEYDSQVSIHNPIDDTYMHQAPPPTVTSQILDNTSEIHHMIQQEPRAIYDVTSMTSHSDVIHHHDDVRCHHHEEAYPYPTTQERMVTTTDVANPMDSLLFMQNSYFRT